MDYRVKPGSAAMGVALAIRGAASQEGTPSSDALAIAISYRGDRAGAFKGG